MQVPHPWKHKTPNMRCPPICFQRLQRTTQLVPLDKRKGRHRLTLPCQPPKSMRTYIVIHSSIQGQRLQVVIASPNKKNAFGRSSSHIPFQPTPSSRYPYTWEASFHLPVAALFPHDRHHSYTNSHFGGSPEICTMQIAVTPHQKPTLDQNIHRKYGHPSLIHVVPERLLESTTST